MTRYHGNSDAIRADAAGKRVRNLIADTWFDKGSHVVPWDGSDDLTRDPSAPSHGLYYIPTHFVAPGNYRVRGLYRKQLDVKFEQGFYTAGSTPWACRHLQHALRRARPPIDARAASRSPRSRR